MIAIRHYSRHLWGVVSDHFSAAVRDEAKATPGLRWDPALKAWVGYRDGVAACAKRLRARGIRLTGSTDECEASPLLVNISRKGLREYQSTGVDWLVTHAAEGALLADDMGCGKSAQAVRAMRALRTPGGFAVVVCPAFVRSVWEAEIPLWWPDAKVALLSGTKPEKKGAIVGAADIRSADVVVLNYDIAHAWADVLTPSVKTVVFDEIHALMSPTSRRTVACRAIARASSNRIGLSGTPMTNRPRDLWSVIDVLSENRFGSFFPYGIRYCDGKKEQVSREKAVWKFDGASHLDELQDRLNSGVMLRRTKSDVMLELPEKTRQILTLDVAKNFLISPAIAMGDDKMLRRALDLAADGVLPQVAELAAESVAAGNTLVIGCHRKMIAENLCERLLSLGIETLFSHGELSLEERKRRIAKQPACLVVTIDSCYQGISLAYANVAVVAEMGIWEPYKLLQFESRFHRHGQKRNVLLQYVVAKGTVAEIVRDTVIRKLDVFEASIGKLDDKLSADFKASKASSSAAALKSMWEEMMR